MMVFNAEIVRWFDKVNGNSYFAARGTLIREGQDDVVFTLPFQYGYGSHPEWCLAEELKKHVDLPNQDIKALSYLCRENGIRLILNDHGYGKKRDCKFD